MQNPDATDAFRNFLNKREFHVGARMTLVGRGRSLMMT